MKIDGLTNSHTKNHVMIQSLGTLETERAKRWVLPDDIYQIEHDDLVRTLGTFLHVDNSPANSQFVFGTTLQEAKESFSD